MVSPTQDAPARLLHDLPPSDNNLLNSGRKLRMYGFQLFALLLGIALAIL